MVLEAKATLIGGSNFFVTLQNISKVWREMRFSDKNRSFVSKDRENIDSILCVDRTINNYIAELKRETLLDRPSTKWSHLSCQAALQKLDNVFWTDKERVNQGNGWMGKERFLCCLLLFFQSFSAPLVSTIEATLVRELQAAVEYWLQLNSLFINVNNNN